MRVRLTRRGRIPCLCEPLPVRATACAGPCLCKPPAGYGEPGNPGENLRGKTGVSRVPPASPEPAG